MSVQKPAVQLHDVSKRFPLYGSAFRQMLGYIGLGNRGVSHKHAVSNVSLTIAHGERVGVVGHNGSGKTTLLRLITGFTRPTEGRVMLDGSIQALMQRGYGFNDALSGLENVRNALVYNGLPETMLAMAEADIVEFVELGEFLHHPVKTYSLGMRARLEFAAATAIHPDVLVIDEVLGAGDGYFVHKCARRMRQLVTGTTLLLVSHSLDQIREYCDRVLWMDGGRLREDGPVDQVLDNYRRYMSEQSARLLKGGSNPALATGMDDREMAVLREKMNTMFGHAESGGRIESFAFGDERNVLAVLETGDELVLRMQIRLDRQLRPVVLGLSQQGTFVFEMTASEALPPGCHDVIFRIPRLAVGVGNYVLVPACAQDGVPAYPLIGSTALELHVAATNWSDPPLVHLDGQWFSGSARTPIPGKVNAWV